MTYRQTARAERTRRAQQGVETQRRLKLQAPAPEYPDVLPTHRRTLIVIDRDFGLRVTRLDLFKTGRVDSYLVHVDGQPWLRLGWSRLLEKLRLSHVRVASPRRCMR